MFQDKRACLFKSRVPSFVNTCYIPKGQQETIITQLVIFHKQALQVAFTTVQQQEVGGISKV